MGIAFYKVKPGDQLFRIIRDHYGATAFNEDQSALVQVVQKNNPHITKIDKIYPGQTIALPDADPNSSNGLLLDPLQQTQASNICVQLAKADPSTFDLASSLNTEKAVTIGGSSFISMVQRASDAAVSDVRKVGLNYYQMKSGVISKGQYDYRRALTLRRADTKLGPLRNLITPGQTAHQVVRIDRHAFFRAQAVVDEVQRLDRIMKLAKRGGFVVMAAEAVSKGFEIHTAPNNQERTVILIDAVSTTAGAATGALIAVALVGTPAGWLALAGIVAAGMAGDAVGSAVGKAIIDKTLYDQNGVRLNTSADRMWRAVYD